MLYFAITTFIFKHSCLVSVICVKQEKTIPINEISKKEKKSTHAVFDINK